MKDIFWRAKAILHEAYIERRRQVEEEGFSTERDDAHDGGRLASAAACYAISGAHGPCTATERMKSLFWPWSRSWWKPKTPRRDMIKAIALLVAEVERMDRLGITEAVHAPEPAFEPNQRIAALEKALTLALLTAEHHCSGPDMVAMASILADLPDDGKALMIIDEAIKQDAVVKLKTRLLSPPDTRA